MRSYEKALVIEDKKIDRRINEVIITKLGLAKYVVSVNSAEEALTYLHSIKDHSYLPNVIFVDLYLPVMSGFEFIEQFKLLPAYIIDYCHLIVISGSLDPADKKRVKSYGIVKHFIEKPLTKDKLESIPHT